jgi:hypothetical protein
VHVRFGERVHCSEPNPILNGFYNFQNESSCKLEKSPLWCSKNYHILHDDSIEDRAQLFFLKQVQIRNRIWIKNYGSRIIFEFDSKLLGIQTGLEESDKFEKNPIDLDLLEYEFRLAWLHDKIWRFHTCPWWLGLRIKEKGFEFEFKLEPSSIAFDSLKFTWWTTIDYKEMTTVKTRDVKVAHFL